MSRALSMASGVSIIAQMRTRCFVGDADEVLGHLAKLLGRRHLRHQDRVGPGRGDREIVEPPGGIEPVDPHQHFAVAEAAILQRLDDQLARLRLGVGRHRVFEVEE